jgi:dTDP-4-dehydrorhamnose 3,5-epimerase
MREVDVSKIDGIRVNSVHSVTDFRGTFSKIHPPVEFQHNLDAVANSINPKRGTIRGIHFQVEPFAEDKIITCLQGAIFDVFVDLRPQSHTFGKWASLELSQTNRLQVFLPKGIAHGFQTLYPNTIVQYFLSTSFSGESSFSIDPFAELGIEWPIAKYVISDKDASGLTFPFAAHIYAASITD